MKPIKIGILASGNLGAACLKLLSGNNVVEFVLTDSKSLDIRNFCLENHIPVFIGNPRFGKAFAFVKKIPVEVILSINYLFIVEKDIIDHPSKYAINIHGSLLPKYRGRTPHVWAIINNEKETGVTAHLITENCDCGDIIYQRPICIHDDDTGADLLRKYTEIYPEVIKTVIKLIVDGTIKRTEQLHDRATYFGKRTEKDGCVNWSWHKERIRNWIRAQAKPYPGAFTFLNNTKIIINKIEFSDLAYNYDMKDGYILKCGITPIIKTPNGAVKLIDYELIGHDIFNEGDILE